MAFFRILWRQQGRIDLLVRARSSVLWPSLSSPIGVRGLGPNVEHMPWSLCEAAFPCRLPTCDPNRPGRGVAVGDRSIDPTFCNTHTHTRYIAYNVRGTYVYAARTVN
jgi:hypothetical protein